MPAMKNPGQQINAQLVAATFRNSFTDKLFFTLEIRNCYQSFALYNIWKTKTKSRFFESGLI